MTTTILNTTELVVTVLLITAILLQQRGTGLGGAFGGGGGVYRSKRGVEQILFRSTIILGILFIVVAGLNVILR